ncbi:MAG: glycine--tRNA ligase [Candidatus Nanoarchaeia archaeon]|nr:glycine--tRNA ligase [Candidatus Nanoarchaeia archaeon]
MKQEFLKELVSFIQNKGFIWGPEPEIYSGSAGFYTYGPLGKLLKNKVENSVRKVFQSNGLWELEAPTVLPDVVWEASGHLNTFKEKIIECEKCKSVFRADKLIEEEHDVKAETFSDKQLLDFIKKNNVRCPSCKGSFKPEIKTQSLMMKTTVAGKDFSLRPETATATYLPYKRFHDFFRGKVPFGVFQIGKAYRNEISPRQHVIRSREFTQAEGQIFIDPKEKNNWEKYELIKDTKLPLWTYKQQKSNIQPKLVKLNDLVKSKDIKTKAYAWCIWLAYQQYISMGIPSEKIRLRQHHPDEKAFYADDAWDVEINLNSFGWTEVCGVHDRTDYDLKQHSKHSKTELIARREDNSTFVPHVLEIAFGTDRPVFSLLDIFYVKKEKGEGKTMFELPYNIAPVDVSIFPLMKKPELTTIATEIKEQLEKEFIVDYDVSGSIGKRYLRSAESGTPFAITIDYDSITNKDVTIRDRDSEKQIRVKIEEISETLRKFLNREMSFGD